MGVEVHPAKEGEIRPVIRKKQASQKRMVEELLAGRQIHPWVWLASGENRFSRNSKYRQQLAEAGIRFEARRLIL